LIEGHTVFKVEFGTKDSDEDSISFPHYLYVDSVGRVWKIESNNGYAIFNYDAKSYYNNVTDEDIKIPSSYIHSTCVFMASWWNNQQLAIDKEFNYKIGENPGYIYDINFRVVKIENIQVPAGNFSTYNVNVTWIEPDDSISYATYWVDTEEFIVIKWMTSPINGDDLKIFNL